MPYCTKKLDLTGQKFGMLTDISPAENIKGRTAWLCRCDCERERVVKTVNLRSGRTKHCGCVKGFAPPPEGVSDSHGEIGPASGANLKCTITF